MATTTLPNLRFYSPISSTKMNKISNVKLNTSSRRMNRAFCSNVMAMAGDEARLQRAKQQQLQALTEEKVHALLNLLNKEKMKDTVIIMKELRNTLLANEEKMKNSGVPNKETLYAHYNLLNKEMMKNRGEDEEHKYQDSVNSLIYLLKKKPENTDVQQMDTMDIIVEDVENGEHSKAKIPWLIKEEQNDYKLKFNMPGMSKNDVKIWIEKNKLVVKAEKIARESHDGQANSGGELSPEHDDWPANSYGRYHKRILLPENIEFEKIKAHVKDGVLYITIPKAEEASAKVIGIDVQ